MTHPKPKAGLNRRSLLSAATLAPAAALAPSLIGSAAAAQGTSSPAGSIGVRRRMIGDIEVIALYDGEMQFPTALLSGFDEGQAKRAAELAYRTYDPNHLQISINGYVIRTGDRIIVVDAGAPKGMSDSVGDWRANLQAAGVDPQSVDTVFLTHAHIDHVGGLSSDKGERYLENAQLVLSDAEWRFTHDDAVLGAIPPDFVPMFLMARALIAPYGEGRDMVGMSKETEIAPGVTAVPLPGHSPGHMGLRIESEGEALLIWGDVLHASAFQFSHPDWSIVFDADPALAGETRTRMLDAASADRLMVAGSHLDFPSVGYVERLGDSYRYVAAPRDYRI